jgi:hypothetical protein
MRVAVGRAYTLLNGQLTLCADHWCRRGHNVHPCKRYLSSLPIGLTCTQLPTLTMLSHLYEVKAIVDVSKQSLEHCARKFNIPQTFTDV